MKIRTITIGLSGLPSRSIIKESVDQLRNVIYLFESAGYVVQTRRIALGHWDVVFGKLNNAMTEEALQELNSICVEFDIDFCSLGIIRAADQIAQAIPVLAKAKRLCASAELASLEHGIHKDSIRAAAEGIRYLATRSDGGLGNFQFGSGFCLQPGNPFFPGSYHVGADSAFAIGFENSDLLVKAFRIAGDRDRAATCLHDILTKEFQGAEHVALGVSKEVGIRYIGMDTSIAPSLAPDESIVEAFHALGLDFGAAGTLNLCGTITDVLKAIPVQRLGYCGLMLSVLEDVGLAAAAGDGRCNISDLLAYSSVCGVGLDLIPVPGDIEIRRLCDVLLDVGTMAVKLRKPLSARILPVAAGVVGEVTNFGSRYLCNSRIMAV